MDRSWNETAYSASGPSRIAFRLLAVYRRDMSAVVSAIAATMSPSRSASRHIRCRKYRSLSVVPTSCRSHSGGSISPSRSCG
jgi:hypothetical protein